MSPARRTVRPHLYAAVYALLALFLVLAHGPILSTPYYWDEVGQFIPASLDLFQTNAWIFQTKAWIAHSTLPNVHPPGLMAWLAAFWHIFGYSIMATRVAMLLIAAFGALATFLLAIELGRGTPGAPAFTAVALFSVSPLFYAQSMLAQLDMPAMAFTALALLLFLQNRFRESAIVCVVLVLIKETGLVAPAVFGCWLVVERRGERSARAALWYLMPLAAICCWLLVLRHATGHWLGNSEFARYNLFYPLNPVRLAFALLRRIYYLFIGSGHFIGTAGLVWAWRRMPLFRDRAWRVAATFAAFHVLAVSITGGAVLERYLLPVLPILYTAFAISMLALMPRARALTFAALVACLTLANFINPIYPFPFENNLAFVHFVELERNAADAISGIPGTVATIFPMADSLRRPEFGYVSAPRQLIEMRDFRRASVEKLLKDRPDMLIVFDPTWDPLHLLDTGPGGWLLRRYYGYERAMTPAEIARLLSMRVAAHWESGGQKMALLQ
jgi:4-amino-4-deoxy-L-arabinose transferase-like glycosyltransferase